MEEIARLLQETMGLDPASVGMASVERAVQQRIAATSCGGPEAYLRFLRATPAETQALVETVVVPETWFFRDPRAFTVVAAHTHQATSPGPLHFLCLPCSTGEEPYSLAMALLNAGVPPERFHIDAIDISERALEHARAGIYGRNSFRGRDLEFRHRYFQETPAGSVLDPAVRRLVHFRRGNLLDENTLPPGRTYDAIFCRNLLIYFDAPTQRRAILTLERLLVPQGLFCVGPAETGLLASCDFTHTRISLAFAFRQGRTVPAPVPSLVKKRTFASVPPPRPQTVAKLAPKLLPRPTVLPAAQDRTADLSAALTLADEGRLPEVAAICHAHLAQSGPSAQAYYLLGLVSDAADRMDEAAACYRKALYLDPRHHDTLLHYSLLTAKRGDTAAAHVLRERARRSMERAA
jgi:chemotaxis protein methyltransferase WspC